MLTIFLLLIIGILLYFLFKKPKVQTAKPRAGKVTQAQMNEKKMLFHLDNPKRILQPGEIVKIPIQEEDQIEHIYVKVVEFHIDHYHGTIAADPINFKNIKVGFPVAFLWEDIEEIWQK